MGLLTGKIADAIYRGFKGKLLKGELRREIPSTSKDEYNDPVSASVQYFAVEGFVDKYSATFRARAGIPDTDLMVAIFAKSAPGLVPQKDDKVTFFGEGKGQWYQLRAQDVDPADALYECQSYQIQPPVDAS